MADWRGDFWRQDVRYAARGLVRAPVFTATVAIVLGIGIGATGAMFALLNAMFLVPPPVRAPERVVHVLAWTGGSASALTAEEARRLEDETRGIEAVAAWTSTTAIVRSDALRGDAGEPLSLSGAVVSSRTFELFDVAPVAGRLFGPHDFTDPARATVLIGERVWRRALHADPRAVGATLRVNGEPRTIAGVLPAAFMPFGHELWLPDTGSLEAARAAANASSTSVARVPSTRDDRFARTTTVLARLKAGVGLPQVQEELRVLAQRIEVGLPAAARGWTLRAQPVRALFGSYPPHTVAWLFAAVVMLWAIACVNVANLLLSRGLDRTREASIRAALGATRGRLLRQFLTEGILLGLFGGLCGLLCAGWSLRLVRVVLPENVVQFGLPRGLASIRLDPLVLLFLLACTCATIVVFALLPAIRAARAASGHAAAPSLAGALTQRHAVTGLGHAWRRRALRDALVVAEIALSVVLLIGAALMLASLRRIATVDRGLTLDRVITLDLQLAAPRPGEPGAGRRDLHDVLREVGAVPGVETAALSSFRLRVPIGLGGEPPSPAASSDGRVDVWTITPEYTAVLGIPLLQGEAFNRGPSVASAPAAAGYQPVLINRTMARRFWPDRDPIGQSFTLASAGVSAAARTTTVTTAAGPTTPPPPDRAIVTGVVGDVRWMRIPIRPFDLDPHPTVYRLRDAADSRAYARLSVRTAAAPALIVDDVRRAIWRVDRDLPIQMQIGEALLARELARPRFNATLGGLFAALAIVLAMLGVYSVVAFAVARARTEIALRLALGARRADIVRLVFAWAAPLAIAGLALGVGAALPLARVARSQLFEVSATDPRLTIAVACAVLVVMACAVCVPARRAARVEPARALGAGVDG